MKQLLLITTLILLGIGLQAQEGQKGVKVYLNPTIINSDLAMPITLALVKEVKDGNQLELHFGPLRGNVKRKGNVKQSLFSLGVGGQYNYFIMKEMDLPLDLFVAGRVGLSYNYSSTVSTNSSDYPTSYAIGQAYAALLFGCQKRIKDHFFADLSMNFIQLAVGVRKNQVANPNLPPLQQRPPAQLDIDLFILSNPINIGIGWMF